MSDTIQVFKFDTGNERKVQILEPVDITAKYMDILSFTLDFAGRKIDLVLGVGNKFKETLEVIPETDVSGNPVYVSGDPQYVQYPVYSIEPQERLQIKLEGPEFDAYMSQNIETLGTTATAIMNVAKEKFDLSGSYTVEPIIREDTENPDNVNVV